MRYIVNIVELAEVLRGVLAGFCSDLCISSLEIQPKEKTT